MLPHCCLNTAKIWANVDEAFIRRTQKPQQTGWSCCASRWRLTCSPRHLFTAWWNQEKPVMKTPLSWVTLAGNDGSCGTVKVTQWPSGTHQQESAVTLETAQMSDDHRALKCLIYTLSPARLLWCRATPGWSCEHWLGDDSAFVAWTNTWYLLPGGKHELLSRCEAKIFCRGAFWDCTCSCQFQPNSPVKRTFGDLFVCLHVLARADQHPPCVKKDLIPDGI